MKKFLIALLAFTSLSATAKSIQFDAWSVLVGDNRISNTFVLDETFISVDLILPGTFAIFAYPTDNTDVGFRTKDITRTTYMVMNINGVNVKTQVDYSKYGSFRIIAETEAGNTYVTNQFWSKTKVSFQMPNGKSFWASAKGVQRAWSFLNSNRAI